MTDFSQVVETPVRFIPSMEVIAPDESETNAALRQILGRLSQATFDHSGHALRAVHAKTHGVLQGEMRVSDNLPPALAQGLFEKPGTYTVAMRLSTIPADIIDDSISVPRGLGLKVIGISGTRLPGSEDDATQDFVLVNAPAFSAPTAKKFLGSLKLLAATVDKGEGAKKVFSALNRRVEAVIEAFGFKSPLVTTLGGHPETHILGETFYSQVPILYGAYVAKICVVPVSPALKALTDSSLDMKGRPNALREAVQTYFAGQSGEWELRVQLCTDLDKMPIEDASIRWPEKDSPYITVARISCAPQDTASPAAMRAIDEGMSFSPWHGLAAHRPLGSIQRVRKAAYEQSAKFRSSHNGCPIHEPKSAGDAKRTV